jgi:hypothetical protein
LQQVNGKLATAQSELQDERQINHALQQNQSAWQAKFQALEKQFNEYKTAKDEVGVIFLSAYIGTLMFLRFGDRAHMLYLGTGLMTTVGLYELPLLASTIWKRRFGLL